MKNDPRWQWLIAAMVVAFATLGARVPAAFSRVISLHDEDTPRIRSWTPDVNMEVERVLSVVERQVGNRARSGKIRDKLIALSPNQLQLLASLADRIQEDPRSAGARIAFLLLTSLIILS